jgi:hypothetical protein
MAHLGTLDGEGLLIINCENAGACRYRIEVFRPRKMIEARGIVIAAPSALQVFALSTQATIELQDGGDISIWLVSWDRTGDMAEVRVTGAIPGF